MERSNNNTVERKEESQEAQAEEKQNVTRYALVPAILTPVCLHFPYGFSIGTINAASTPIQQFYNQSYMLRFGDPIDHSTLDLLWALTASLFPLGGVCGALFVRPLVARFERRRTLLMIQTVSVLATILMSSSYALASYEALMIGRFMLGWHCAVATGVGPMYVSEISANHIHGPVGGLFSVSVAIGILIGNVLGLKQILGTSTRWPYLLAITCVPSIVFLLCGMWLPKSPRALYLDKGKREEAEEVLRRLRGTEDVSKEVKALQQQALEALYSKPMTIKQVLTTRRVRWQVVSTMVVLSSFQLCGINGIQFFLDEVFIIAGIPEDIVVYVTLGTVVLQVCVTLAGGFLIEKFGRKTLLLAGYGTISISMVLYTLMAGFQHAVPWFSYISLVAALSFIIGFCFGAGPTAYVLAPEILDQATRPAAMTLGVLGLWSSFALVGFVTPYMFEHLKFAAFLPFLVVTIATFVYVYLIIPETKGKSLLEVQAIFAKRNKCATSSALNCGKKNLAFSTTTNDDFTEIDRL